MNEPIRIYALMKGRQIAYVGQSIKDKGPLGSRHVKKKLHLKILRLTDVDNCDRLEYQIIRACKRRGLCWLNKKTKTSHQYRDIRGQQIKCVETGQTFVSYAQAARHFKVGGSTMRKALNRDSNWYNSICPKHPLSGLTFFEV